MHWLEELVLSTSLQLIQEAGEIQRNPLAHPYSPLGVIPQLDRCVRAFLYRVWMDEYRERAPPDHEPRHESAELCRREQIDLEHGYRVWANWAVPERIYPEFRDCVAVEGVLAHLRGNGIEADAR